MEKKIILVGCYSGKNKDTGEPWYVIHLVDKNNNVVKKEYVNEELYNKIKPLIKEADVREVIGKYEANRMNKLTLRDIK